MRATAVIFEPPFFYEGENVVSTSSSLRSWRDSWASSLYQSSHGFATRVHGFATKTKALGREIPPATQATLVL